MIVQNRRSFRAGRIGTTGQGCAASNAPFAARQRLLDLRLLTFKLQFKALAKGLQQAWDLCHQAYRRP
jgi:hypothetical protein